MAIFKGAGVAIVTPMKDNFEVNYDGGKLDAYDGRTQRGHKVGRPVYKTQSSGDCRDGVKLYGNLCPAF